MNGHLSELGYIRQHVSGFIYPNEVEPLWGLLIVIYPYLTGLVAGAFILASLEKVFSVKELQPTYRLSLLAALSFLIVAPMPLMAHLGHPERSLQMFLTPNPRSAMAMFGFIYAWYLLVVLLLEIWFDYRADMVRWSREGPLIDDNRFCRLATIIFAGSVRGKYCDFIGFRGLWRDGYRSTGQGFTPASRRGAEARSGGCGGGDERA